MNGKPTAAAAGKVDVGGDLTVNRLEFGAMRITGPGSWGDPPDRDRARPRPAKSSQSRGNVTISCHLFLRPCRRGTRS